MREAYAAKSWSFGHGEGVEQCEREHYGEQLDSQRREGCRVEGGIRVNKVVGNFHFAPGKSFSNGNMHVHDLDNYFRSAEPHTFSHKVHHLRFGPQLPEDVVRRMGTPSSGAGGRSGMPWTSHHLSPLDDTAQDTAERAFNFMYFIKVVSTSYLPLGWETDGSAGAGAVNAASAWTGAQSDVPHELIELGMYGHGDGGSIEAHQYSVTSHKRNLQGGDDSADGHRERLHARGGIPGVFFSYVSYPSSAGGPRACKKSFQD